MPIHIEQSSSCQWHPQITNTKFCATAVAFNQHVPNVMAVGTGQNFGIAGKGCQHVYSISQPSSHLRCSFSCTQAVLDCAWSERSPSVLGAALGDGTVMLWDIREARNDDASRPIAVFNIHTKECFSLEWNVQMTNLLLTSSWDLSVKICDTEMGKEVLCLPRVHQQAVYTATWCPSQPTVFATCGGDGRFKILDVKEKPMKSAWSIGEHIGNEGELLSIDWNKFSPFIIATSGIDNAIRIWDIRKLQTVGRSMNASLSCLLGHSLAVRRVHWSPFREAVLASGSYDMSVGVWDCREQLMMHRYSHHSEFVIDIDWNLFEDGIMASASWDGTVAVWDGFGAVGPPRLRQRIP